MTNEDSELNLDFARLLVEAARRSMSRSRAFFLVVSLVASIQIVACWNLYFSWLRDVFLADSWASSTPTVADAQKELLHEWVDSIFISLPVLGIKVSIADASVLGSVCMTVLMVGVFFTMRRQNHVIGKSLRMAKEYMSQLNLKKYVYYGISMDSIFHPVTKNDDPIRSLAEPPDEPRRIKGIRPIFISLYFLPATAIVFVVICDLLSIFVIHSIFRDNHSIILEAAGGSAMRWIRVVTMDTIAIIAACLCTFLAVRCKSYQDGCVDVLQAFAEHLYSSDVSSSDSA